MDGGRFPPPPHSAPCFGCRGGGFMQIWLCGAPLPAWRCCIRPPSCVVRGGGGALGYRNRYFYTLFLRYCWFVCFFFLASELLMVKKLLIKICSCGPDTVPVPAGGGVATMGAGSWARPRRRLPGWGRGNMDGWGRGRGLFRG